MSIRIFVLLPLLMGLTSCHTPTNVVSSNPILAPTVQNQSERLDMVGALSTGVEVSLEKKDIPSATKLNSDIQAVANQPSPEAVRMVISSLDNADIAKDLDKQISKLVADKSELEKKTLGLVTSLTTKLVKAKDSERAAKERLDELSNPFTAITYGIKTIVKRLAWTLVGCGTIFFLLKIFATSNPIVGAIFDVLQRIVGWLVTAIASIFPKAIAFGSKAFQLKDDTLDVIVDAIEVLPKTATIAELKDQLAKDTDLEHRDEIDAIKRRLGW